MIMISTINFFSKSLPFRTKFAFLVGVLYVVVVVVVVVVVKTLFKSHTLTSSTISWFPRGACELHRKIHNLNATYIYTGQIAHLRCAMLRKQAYVSIKSIAKVFKTE